jgi:hypothetical protein
LKSNTTGDLNVASGTNALAANTSGFDNLAGGVDALLSNQTGHDNVADGFNALLNATGSRHVALGSGAGQNLTTGSNDIDIASPGAAGESGTIRIGTATQARAFLQGVYGKTIGGPTQGVVVNSAGRLGTAPAPAAPALKSQSKTLGRLRDNLREQRAENRRQSAEIASLRQLVQRRTR